MKIHELKTNDFYFKQVFEGRKHFELRKDDRDFDKLDVLHLREIDKDLEYTGRECLARVTSILKNYQGLEKGFCIMSIQLLSRED